MYLGCTTGNFPSHPPSIFADFAGFANESLKENAFLLQNGQFSKKEMGFSGSYVVRSVLGASGEKKRDNQMFLQYLHTFVRHSQHSFQNRQHFCEIEYEFIMEYLIETSQFSIFLSKFK